MDVPAKYCHVKYLFLSLFLLHGLLHILLGLLDKKQLFMTLLDSLGIWESLMTMKTKFPWCILAKMAKINFSIM